jgi:hypothetical protein
MIILSFCAGNVFKGRVFATALYVWRVYFRIIKKVEDLLFFALNEKANEKEI